VTCRTAVRVRRMAERRASRPALWVVSSRNEAGAAPLEDAPRRGGSPPETVASLLSIAWLRGLAPAWFLGRVNKSR
jgi:hypothetical protein